MNCDCKLTVQEQQTIKFYGEFLSNYKDTNMLVILTDIDKINKKYIEKRILEFSTQIKNYAELLSDPLLFPIESCPNDDDISKSLEQREKIIGAIIKFAEIPPVSKLLLRKMQHITMTDNWQEKVL